MKVLIAEDNKISSRILEKNIKNWGYEVCIARNGKDAWNSFQENNIRIAILDWMMPRIDGLELCRKIRQRKGHNYTYVIILTSKNQQKDIIKGLSAGADDYMIKPFNNLELKARLDNGKRIIHLEDKLLKSQKKLLEIATHDSLTGLWNRATILNLLREELDRSKREGHPTGVIMIDIDHFKKVNDSFGHVTGDKVLTELSSCLKKLARSFDNVGRYGGDEFLIVFPRCGLEEIKKIAERFLFSVRNKKFKAPKKNLGLTVSIGGASTDCFSIASTEKLVRACDESLYKAKKKGRNCIALIKYPGFQDERRINEQ